MTDNRSASAGFSLAEIVIAMLILSIGLLGMAAGTGWMIRSVDVAKVETTRTAAIQESVEFVRTIPFETLEATASGTRTVGDYEVSWTRTNMPPHGIEVEFELVGPGRVAGAGGPMPVISNSASDTYTYWRVRP